MEDPHERKVGIGETGDTATTGRGRIQGISNIIQGGGAGNPNVRDGDGGPLGVMEGKLEGINAGFLQQITGKQAERLGDGTWEITGAEGVQETGKRSWR